MLCVPSNDFFLTSFSDVISVKNSFSYKVSVNEVILIKYSPFHEHVKTPQPTKFKSSTFKDGKVTGPWKIPIMTS